MLLNVFLLFCSIFQRPEKVTSIKGDQIRKHDETASEINPSLVVEVLTKILVDLFSIKLHSGFIVCNKKEYLVVVRTTESM